MDQDRSLLRSCNRHSASPIPLYNTDLPQMEDSGDSRNVPTSHPSFHFVHVSGTSRYANSQDSRARKACRSHVMHDFVRKKQQNSVHRLSSSRSRMLRMDTRPSSRASRRLSQSGFRGSRSTYSDFASETAMAGISTSLAELTPSSYSQYTAAGIEIGRGETGYYETTHVAEPGPQHSMVINSRKSSLNEAKPLPSSFGPQSLLVTGNPDPFSTLNVVMTPKMEHYVLRYLKSVIPAAVRPQHSTDIVNIGRSQLHSSAVLFSSIAVAAAFDRFHNGSLSLTVKSLMDEQTQPAHLPEFFFFKVKAIEAINSSLDDLAQGTSDSTIGAILNICGLESMLNDSGQLRVHLKGLRQIIKQRGGLHSLPQLLQNSVSFVDVLTCHSFDDVLLFEAPTLPYKRPSDLIARMLTSEYPSLRCQASTLLELSCFIAIHPSLVDVWRDLRNLTNFSVWCKIYPNSVTADQVRYFRVKYHHVEHSLITLGNEETIPILPRTTFQESCRLATRLFVNSVLFKGLPSTPRTRLLVKSLKSNLEASLQDPMGLAAQGRALFWILSMGSLCSAGQVERPWFALQLAKMGRALNVSDWETAKEVLSGCFYLESSTSAPLQRSWEEAQLLTEAFVSG